MFDRVPPQVWLLIASAAVAYQPVRYLYRHVVHSPSRRDITQPHEDLSWRTSGQFARSLGILAALIGFAVFIFTPAAEQFARSPRFLPILLACLGAWALFTAPQGFLRGQIQPFAKGFYDTYERETQPKRFWASLTWNALFGCLCIWLAWQSNEEALAQVVEDRCYDQSKVYSPREELSACNTLIADPDRSRDDLADLLGARGIAYHRLGDYRRAVSDYSEAIHLNPRDSYSHFNRGLIYYQLGDSRRAVTDFTQAIRLRPNDADAHFNRGLVFLDAGAFDEAVTDFTRAHELDTKDAWALANRGIAFAWKKDQANAEADFKAVRAIDPSNPVMLRGEALLRMNAGDTRGAVNRLTASMLRDPDNLWALRKRAELYSELGEHEKSREDDSRWLKLMKEARAKRG